MPSEVLGALRQRVLNMQLTGPILNAGVLEVIEVCCVLCGPRVVGIGNFRVGVFLPVFPRAR